MIFDGIVDLINLGVIINKKKNFNFNKVIVMFLMGSKKLYDYVNDNFVIELYFVDYVNNFIIIV